MPRGKAKDFIREEVEVVEKPKDAVAFGEWVKQRYLNGCENMRVATGISISVTPQGGNNYEINIVGEKSQIVAGSIDEAKNTAKNMLRDKLTSALEVSK